MFQIRDQQGTIPDLIASAESPLLEIKNQLKILRNTGESLLNQRRSSERELAIQDEQLQKVRSRLSELKTNKEYQAHLYEIELARKKKDSIEENVLEMMEKVEENEKAIAELEGQVAEIEKEFEVEKTRLESQLASLTDELTQLTQEQEALASSVEKPLLQRYNRLKTLRKGFAVAQVNDGACAGCRLQLPPQLVAEVKRGDELLDCSYCHRILYMAHHLEVETTE